MKPPIKTCGVGSEATAEAAAYAAEKPMKPSLDQKPKESFHRLLGIRPSPKSVKRKEQGPVMRFVFLLLAAFLAFFSVSARADLGPKPQMHFAFVIEDDLRPDLSTAQLLVCQKADCSDAEPLRRLGPQGFTCSGPDACRAMAYGFLPYAVLELRLPNGEVMRSNIFEKKAFDAQYIVTLTASSLKVIEQ